MRDFMGREILVGDTTVYAVQSDHRLALRKGIVTRTDEGSATLEVSPGYIPFGRWYTFRARKKVVLRKEASVVILRRGSAPGEESRQ